MYTEIQISKNVDPKRELAYWRYEKNSYLNQGLKLNPTKVQLKYAITQNNENLVDRYINLPKDYIEEQDEKTLKERLGAFISIKVFKKNHQILYFKKGTILVSYETIIAYQIRERILTENLAVNHTEKVYLTKDWAYSNTTGKHRNQFLNEGIKETRKKIKSGEYTLLTK